MLLRGGNLLWPRNSGTLVFIMFTTKWITKLLVPNFIINVIKLDVVMKKVFVPSASQYVKILRLSPIDVICS